MIPKTKKKGKESDDDDFIDDSDDDFDTPSKSKKTPKGKKTPKTPKTPGAKVDDPDPWELGAKKTRGDWRQMRCPPLFELFAWKRVVTDEFTYLEGNQVTLLNTLRNVTTMS